MSSKKTNVVVDLRKQFQKGSSLYKMVETEKAHDQNAERIISFGISEIRSDPDLRGCSEDSLKGAILATARLGLYPGKLLGQAYFVKYRNNKKNIDECQLIMGYKGMISLALRSGYCKAITAHCVYKNDYFDFELGLNERLVHRPAMENRGPLIAAYATAELENGLKAFTVMFKYEIDKIKGNKKYGVWVDHYDEMAKKTAIRRLFKYLPLTPDMAAANEFENRYDLDKSQNLHLQTKEEGNIYDMDEIDEEPQAQSDQESVDRFVQELQGS